MAREPDSYEPPKEKTFDEQVQYFAQRLIADASDIRDTYENKPENLKALFNVSSGAQQMKAIAWFVGAALTIMTLATTVEPAALLFLPIFGGIGFLLARPAKTADQKVSADVAKHKASAGPTPSPSN